MQYAQLAANIAVAIAALLLVWQVILARKGLAAQVNLIQPITDVWKRRRDKLEEGKGGHSTS